MNNNRNCAFHILEAVGGFIKTVKTIKELDANLSVSGLHPLDRVDILLSGAKDIYTELLETTDSLSAYSDCTNGKSRSLSKPKKKRYSITGLGMVHKATPVSLYALPIGVTRSKH